MPAHTLNRAFQRAEAHIARGGIDCGNAKPGFAAAGRLERVNGYYSYLGELSFQLRRNIRQAFAILPFRIPSYSL